jgi:hypothetical protein
MRTDYTNQLNDIEEEFKRERVEILTNNEKEIQQLFAMQKQLEQEYTRKRDQKEEEHTTELENLRT